jgi:membrane protease YdiL (CAAX protease family)
LVLLISLLHGFLQLAGWVAILVVGIVRWSDIRPSLRPGVVVAGMAFALSLPGFVITAVFMDLSALLPPIIRGLAPYLSWMSVIMGFAFTIIGTAHIVLQVGLATLAVPGRAAFPLLTRAPDPFRGWVWAAVFGIAAGLLSTWLFHVMGIKAGSATEMLQKMFPGLDSYPPIVVMLAFVPAFLAAALTEEVLYRGVLQAWLARALGDGRAAVLAAILVTSVLWAMAHAANASPMLPKLLQVLLLGFALGGLARRYGVEASIVGHAALNLTAVAGAALLTALGKL